MHLSRRVFDSRGDLAALRRLYDLNLRMVGVTDSRQLWQAIVDAAVVFQGAQAGFLELRDPEDGKLEVVAWRGLASGDAVLLARAAYAGEHQSNALPATGRIVEPKTAAGSRAAHATHWSRLCALPLSTQAGERQATVTTCFGTRERPTARQLRANELFARQMGALLERACVEDGQRRERRRADEALRSAQQDLIHAGRLSSLSELIASIAHEISQPLAAIITNGHATLHWLARETPNVGEARAAVTRLLEDGQRASQVVHRLRALALKRVPQEARVDILALVRETLALAAHELERHGVQVELDAGSTLVVTGDRVQLQQVVSNLIDNAIENMLGPGDRPRELAIGVHDRGSGELILSFRDSGIGVPGDELERMFEPFFTTRAGSLGLGLSICQRIVAAHGGRIWATQNGDVGLTVWVVLPAGG